MPHIPIHNSSWSLYTPYIPFIHTVPTIGASPPAVGPKRRLKINVAANADSDYRLPFSSFRHGPGVFVGIPRKQFVAFAMAGCLSAVSGIVLGFLQNVPRIVHLRLPLIIAHYKEGSQN